MSADEIAREALLTARLVTNLCKVRLAPSTIRGAGDGLFAAVDIEEGEIIIDVPMALGLMFEAGAWPVKAFFELKNGTLTAPESEITVSPR